MSKVLSKRTARKNRNRKRRKWIVPSLMLFLSVFALILFILAHVLHTVYTLSSTTWWMGIRMNSFIVDLTFYSAIFLIILVTFLIFIRNFRLRRRKG